MASKSESRLSIDKPLWDLNTFWGRVKYFAWVTDPRTVVVPQEKLLKAKELVELYRLGKEPPGTTREELIYARKLYESAFHPDSKELQNVFGRMSFQVPGGMAITGAMLQFYRTPQAVIFWQWVNQSFNALVNYTNRNANSPISTTQMVVSYVAATTSAVGAALGSRVYLKRIASPFFQRYVPFAAVAAANFVNIPCMRQTEIINGIDVYDENGNIATQSRLAPMKGIFQVVISRVVMCAPGMLLMPPIMAHLEQYPKFQRMKALHAPFQVLVVGCFLTFMVPIACALFPQTCSLKINTMKWFEPEQYEKLKLKYSEIPQYVYFNKGL